MDENRVGLTVERSAGAATRVVRVLAVTGVLAAANLLIGKLSSGEGRRPAWIPDDRIVPTLLLAGVALLLVRAAERRWREPGVASAFPRRSGAGAWLPWGIALGVIVNGLGPAILTVAGHGRIAIAPPIPPLTALLTAFTFLTSSFWEEVFFRGHIQRRLSIFGPVPAWLLASLLFAALHFLGEEPSLPRFLFLLAVGLMLGLAYWKSRSLWFSIGIHAGMNGVHLALGGDRGFPAAWPFVTRVGEATYWGAALLGVAAATAFSLALARDRENRRLAA